VGWRRHSRHSGKGAVATGRYRAYSAEAMGLAALKQYPVALKLQGVTEPVELNLQGTLTGNRGRYRWRVRGFRAHKYRLHITVE